MIGTGSAERREAGELLAADEIEHGFAVVEVADLERGGWLRLGAAPTRAGDQAPNHRHDARRDFAAAVDGQRLRGHRAEGALAAAVFGRASAWRD